MTLADRYLYRQVTGDQTSLDADVDGALADAQSEVEQSFNRFFEQMSRTEIVRIHSDGRAYPKATPLVSVSAPAGAIIRDACVMGLWPQANPLWDPVYEPFRFQDIASSVLIGGSDATMPFATITYVGGYTSDTVPRKLRDGICEIARIRLTVQQPAAAGVTRAAVGDVSAAWSEPPDRNGLVAGVLEGLRGFARRELGY